MKDVLADGIVAARVKRMAARQPAQPHPDSLGSAVTLHGLAHIVRTGRKIAAGRRKEWRNQELVPAEGAVDKPLHRRNRRSTSRCSSTMGASKALRRGLMTMDHCGLNRSRWRRTASRTRRLIRFRTTALPIARGTVNPIRGPSGCGSRTQKAAKRGPENREPWS